MLQPNYYQYAQPTYYQYQTQPQINQQIQQPQPPSLYGKIVDGIETARGQDVPIGQSGIYPKADGTAVYIKTWNNDGTTNVSEYQKISIEDNSNKHEELLTNIFSCLDELNKKIDKLSKSTTKKKKIEEVDEDDE